jgi:OMF family outer membrane factor
LAAGLPSSFGRAYDARPTTSPIEVAVYDLPQCIAVALANQPAIEIQQKAARIAAEQVNVARSLYLPQVGIQGRYAALDEPRSVDIDNAYPPQVADVFSDAAAYFQLARQAGTATADFALENPQTPIFPNGPTFDGLKQQATAALPRQINVGLLGENSFQSQIAAVQPLWTGGKIEAQNERAHIGSRVAIWDVARTRQLTQFHVAQAYYSILLVSEQFRVVANAEDHAKAVERLAQSLLEEGDPEVTSVDSLRASTFRNLYAEQRVGLARLHQRAYAALKLSMGLDQSVELLVADQGLSFTPVELSGDEIIAAALANRPEVIQARLGINAAAWQHRAARAELKPDVVAFAGFSTIYDDANFPNPNDSEEWSAGVSAQMPLYAGGRRMAQIRQASLGWAQARDRFDQARQFVMQEAQDAYLEYREMLERKDVARRAAEDAEQALQDLQDQFTGGLIDDDKVPKYFEDALTTRFLTVAAWTRYYQALFGYELALARVRLVTGTDEPFIASTIEELPRPDDDSAGSPLR